MYVYLSINLSEKYGIDLFIKQRNYQLNSNPKHSLKKHFSIPNERMNDK